MKIDNKLIIVKDCNTKNPSKKANDMCRNTGESHNLLYVSTKKFVKDLCLACEKNSEQKFISRLFVYTHIILDYFVYVKISPFTCRYIFDLMAELVDNHTTCVLSIRQVILPPYEQFEKYILENTNLKKSSLSFIDHT